MPASQTLSQFPPFGAYADPFKASETALSFWSEYWRTSASVALWWTERCLQAPIAFLSWTPGAAFKPASPPRRAAAVIDLAQAAAARMAAEAVEIVETVAEVPLSMAEEVVPVVESVAAEPLKLDPDDLTRLVGIGPKLSVALAERGVTRFEHIAAWTDKELAEIDKALDLKGRAVRDAWVAQAKRFAAEA
jgi:predicted flap endonuclease-1-like 5' DNA nuclease